MLEISINFWFFPYLGNPLQIHSRETIGLGVYLEIEMERAFKTVK